MMMMGDGEKNMNGVRLLLGLMNTNQYCNRYSTDSVTCMQVKNAVCRGDVVAGCSKEKCGAAGHV